MKEIKNFVGVAFKFKTQNGEKLPVRQSIQIHFSLVKNADSPSGIGFVKAEFANKSMKVLGLFAVKKVGDNGHKVMDLYGYSTERIAEMKNDENFIDFGMFLQDLDVADENSPSLKAVINFQTLQDLHLFKQVHARKDVKPWEKSAIHDDRILCIYESSNEVPLRQKKGYGKSFRIHENAFGLENVFSACYKYEETSDKMQAEAKKAEQTRETRKAAKALGGKALKGTAKQKSWAEGIRKSFLGKIDSQQAELVLSSDIAQSAKFWIETRTASINEIIDVIKNPNTFDNLISELKRKEREAQIAEIRKQGNRYKR